MENCTIFFEWPRLSKYGPSKICKVPSLYTLVAIAFATMFARNSCEAETIYGMTTVDSTSTSAGLALVSFSSSAPGTIITENSFSGIVAGQSLRSIDFRPSNGLLYALSSSGSAAQLYTVNLSNATLTAVGSGFTLPSTNARVEIEFDPVADNIRVIRGTATNNNLTVNPNTGALIATQTTLNVPTGDPLNPDGLSGSISGIVGTAYSNNTAGASSTTLYGFDFLTSALVRIGGLNGSPSADGGLVTTINKPASLSNSNAGLGMDISGATGTLFETHDDPTGTFMSFFSRNLTTGAKTLIGNYPAGVFIQDIAVAPVPEPSTIVLGSSAALLFASRSRFRRSTASKIK
ncbi:MAG: DUF4394 domain-containing protein [Chthoniobacteraceae bacterium]